jgi:NADPH:quinone reductase-like Zn-dependent oxidoreductase
MKAIVFTQYGTPDVLRLQEVAQPTPKADEALVEIYAASINAADWYALTGQPFMTRLVSGSPFKPKHICLGSAVAGRVMAVGSQVTAFAPGDEVYADLSTSGLGGLAEYATVPQRLMAHKPARLSWEEAAAVPLAAGTALLALRDSAAVQPGQQVLIYGASGGVGTFAVQIAKARGAEVTAVCSTSKIDLMHSLGADHVIDYTREDFSAGGARYDVIVAVNGYRPLRDYQRALRPQGTYVMVGGTMRQIFEALLLGGLRSKRGGQRFVAVTANAGAQELNELRALIDAGQVRPVIDRCYPLDSAANAMRALGGGHTRGKLVVSLGRA